MSGRLLAIGDIHGQRAALEGLLAEVGLGEGDRLVFLGDYIHGGPDSAGVLDVMAEVSRRPGVVCLLGNHDELMKRALARDDWFETWRFNAGASTAASYVERGGLSTRRDVPVAHARFLSRLSLWHEVDEAIFVHGSVEPQAPMDEQYEDVLLWGKADGARGHVSGKRVICGHTRQRTGLPLDLGHTICIDTAAKSGGYLTCLDVKVRWCWQADVAGRVREFPLDKPPAGLSLP